MACFVLVHGAFHGGWCWRRVADALVRAGHRVFTPTLTGLGDRYHLATPDVDLNTHVRDITALFKWENLEDVILVGHSYGGMVVGTAAAHLQGRLAALVYLDALIPRDGKSALDLNPPDRAARFRDAASEHNGWQVPQPSAAYYGVGDPGDQAWVDGLCVPQPLAALATRPQIPMDPHETIPVKAYLLCTDPALEYMRQFYDFAEAAADWQADMLATGHDAMVTMPAEVSQYLENIAAQTGN